MRSTPNAEHRAVADGASLLDDIVERSVFVSEGKSGSLLERAALHTGEVVILKHIAPGGDWIMRATHDQGRAGHLWSAGLLDRVPPVIEHAVVAVEQEGDGWVAIMRDVSAALLADDDAITRSQSRRILHAVSLLHEAFAGSDLDDLCTLTDRYGFLSPRTARRESTGVDTVPKLLARGWELFAEVAPRDVVEAIFTLLDRPELLVGALGRHTTTLVHGDLKLANIGFLEDRIVLLDWGSLTGCAPAAVDFAWYLAVNATRIDATHDEVVEDFRSISGADHDEAALNLSLLGGLVQLGWDKALGAVDHPDEGVRRQELLDLEWWYAAARTALELWSPS